MEYKKGSKWKCIKEDEINITFTNGKIYTCQHDDDERLWLISDDNCMVKLDMFRFVFEEVKKESK